jgi:thiol-disulfide isomerase/thioredoxin
VKDTRTRATVLAAVVLAIACATGGAPFAAAQDEKDVHWNAGEKPLADKIDALRALPDKVRADATRNLAVRILNLPPTGNKLRLATSLAGMSTEGDFGSDTLQQVATTLAATLREHPMPWTEPQASDSGKFAAALMPSYAYRALAQLVRYENVAVSLHGDGHFRDAMTQLEADDRRRAHADFALQDLSGKSRRLSDLRGKIVLVNFWATWCAVCPQARTLISRAARSGAHPVAALALLKKAGLEAAQ